MNKYQITVRNKVTHRKILSWVVRSRKFLVHCTAREILDANPDKLEIEIVPVD